MCEQFPTITTMFNKLEIKMHEKCIHEEFPSINKICCPQLLTFISCQKKASYFYL